MEKKFIDIAIKLASQSVSLSQGGPFGAVIVKEGKVVGQGINRVTSHNDPTAHAEIEAIRDAGKTLQSFSLKGCTLYASSEPCPMCLSAIYWARIDTVYFANTYQQASQIGFDDQFIYNELNLPHQAKKLTIARVKEKSSLLNALKVFQDWENSHSKQPY